MAVAKGVPTQVEQLIIDYASSCDDTIYTVSAIDVIKRLHPRIAQAFEQNQKESYELFARKMLDYGKGNIAVGTNLDTDEEIRLALTGIFFRMNDKIQRFKNLYVLNKGANVEDESLKDTMMDLGNYSNIAQIVASGEWQ